MPRRCGYCNGLVDVPANAVGRLPIACVRGIRSARHSEVTALNGAAREVWMERAGDR